MAHGLGFEHGENYEDSALGVVMLLHVTLLESLPMILGSAIYETTAKSARHEFPVEGNPAGQVIQKCRREELERSHKQCQVDIQSTNKQIPAHSVAWHTSSIRWYNDKSEVERAPSLTKPDKIKAQIFLLFPFPFSCTPSKSPLCPAYAMSNMGFSLMISCHSSGVTSAR